MANTFDADSLGTTLTSIGAGALPWIGGAIGGAVALAGLGVGVNKGLSYFKKVSNVK